MAGRPITGAEEATVAVRDGDASAFAALAERYRRQLHVRCYRMFGSFEDAEDLMQETLLRAQGR
jgi:DNA-directed RNA polymerase specialized sigma24 family protein